MIVHEDAGRGVAGKSITIYHLRRARITRFTTAVVVIKNPSTISAEHYFIIIILLPSVITRAALEQSQCTDVPYSVVLKIQ